MYQRRDTPVQVGVEGTDRFELTEHTRDGENIADSLFLLQAALFYRPGKAGYRDAEADFVKGLMEQNDESDLNTQYTTNSSIFF